MKSALRHWGEQRAPYMYFDDVRHLRPPVCACAESRDKFWLTERRWGYMTCFPLGLSDFSLSFMTLWVQIGAFSAYRHLVLVVDIAFSKSCWAATHRWTALFHTGELQGNIMEKVTNTICWEWVAHQDIMISGAVPNACPTMAYISLSNFVCLHMPVYFPQVSSKIS